MALANKKRRENRDEEERESLVHDVIVTFDVCLSNLYTQKKQQAPANDDLRNLLKKRNVESSIPTETRSKREEKDGAYFRALAIQTTTLVDVSSSFARPLDVPKF